MLGRACDVLVAEQDQGRLEALRVALSQQGLALVPATSAEEAERLTRTQAPSAIVVNPRMAPDDGWKLCADLAALKLAPLVVISPETDPLVPRLALALGADDCIVGSDLASEVAVRVRRLMGRGPRSGLALIPGDGRSGNVRFDPDAYAARAGQKSVDLTPSEYRLLGAMTAMPGRVFTRSQLIPLIGLRQRGLALDRTVDMHVHGLRRKLEPDPKHPRLILTVRGFGYRLEEPVPVAPPQLSPATLSAALQALPEPVMITDSRRQVEYLNEAAEQLVGLPRASVLGRCCGDLLRCRTPDGKDVTEEQCPGLAVLSEATGRVPRRKWVSCAMVAAGRLATATHRALSSPGEEQRLLIHLKL